MWPLTKTANKRQLQYIDYPHKNGSISVAIERGTISDVIQDKIKNGRYEKHETSTIWRIIENDDVLLDIGSGVGVVSCIAWATGKVKEVHCFEADPRLIDLIKATHTCNGARGSVYNQILAPKHHTDNKHIDFHIRENFYGSSVSSSIGAPVIETVQVPIRYIQEAIDTIKPTVISCDIEGAESDLFRDITMPTVTRVMLEVHIDALEGDGMQRLFEDMHKNGYFYDPKHSYRAVVVFKRI